MTCSNKCYKLIFKSKINTRRYNLLQITRKEHLSSFWEKRTFRFRLRKELLVNNSKCIIKMVWLDLHWLHSLAKRKIRLLVLIIENFISSFLWRRLLLFKFRVQNNLYPERDFYQHGFIIRVPTAPTAEVTSSMSTWHQS